MTDTTKSNKYSKWHLALLGILSVIFLIPVSANAQTPTLTDMVLDSGIDIEKEAIIIGSPTRPVRTTGGVVTLDFHAAHGTKIYVTEDPYAERLNFENLDLCAREDMNCAPLGKVTQDNWPRVSALCQNGQWSIEYGGGQCVRPFGCCYRNRSGNIYVDHGCRRINSKEIANVSYTHNLTRICNPDDYLKPTDKQYCLYDYDNKPGVESVDINGRNVTFIGGMAGDTEDDMFRIKPGAEGIIVYRKPEENGDSYPYRALYVEDNRDEDARHAMIPSGPLVSFADWENFATNPPEGITVRRVDTTGEVYAGAGCPPVSISLCADIGEALPEPPTVDADCGLADDDPAFGGAADGYNGPDGKGFVSTADIPNDGFCAFGDPQIPTNQSNPNYLTWTCAPPAELGPGEIDSCRAKRVAAYDPPPEKEDKGKDEDKK